MNKRRVIIVEDDVDLLENIVAYLELENFDVKGTTCALDFFQALTITDYEIAIVDIGLPDKSGFEVVDHLRNNTKLGIIVLTARDTIKDKMRGYDAGADYYFVKPLDSRELVASINNLLKRLGKNSAGNVSLPAQVEEWIFDPRNWAITSPTGFNANQN